MPALIVVRLLPVRPTTGDLFSAYLEDLTLEAWDRTIQDTSTDLVLGDKDVFLGKAFGLVPLGKNLELTLVPGQPPAYKDSIMQHFASVPVGPPAPPGTTKDIPKAVATALIVVNLDLDSHPEYASRTAFDVRFVAARGTEPVDLPLQVDYNIVAMDNVDITAELNTPAWVTGLDTSSYVYVPAPPPPDVATIVLGNAATPPNFDKLVKTIDKVLAKEHPTTAPSLAKSTEPLTPAQCSEIACEIIYNRDADPPPVPGGNLEFLYTYDDNTQQATGYPDHTTWDDVRKSFETAMQAYRSTNDANADRLAQYVFAASAAVWAEQKSSGENRATVDIPIVPKPGSTDPPTSLTIFLTSSDPRKPPLQGTLDPTFVVPAAYFYALGYKYPMRMQPSERYKNAVTTPVENLSDTMQSALDTGILQSKESTITLPAGNKVTTNMPQAVRRIAALSAAFITGPDPKVWLTAEVNSLFTRWQANDTPVDIFTNNFWDPEMTSPAVPSDYLMLLLNIITADNSDFIKAIRQMPVDKPADLRNIEDSVWVSLFNQHPDWLPPTTVSGSVARRTAAFLASLRDIFQPKFNPGQANSPIGETVPTFSGPSEILQRLVSAYAGTFSFSNPLDMAKVDAALTAAFPDDLLAQDWVRNAITTIAALFEIVTKAAIDPKLQVSYMEALYARGFTSVDSIMEFTDTQFEAAMAGTVAFSAATGIWNAVKTTGPVDGGEPGFGFQPVNPGSLVNCVPPEHLSPLGLCEYLKGMLSVDIGGSKLNDFIVSRRGDLGGLSVTEANLAIQLPLVDLVLESLENLGNLTVLDGAVYDTDPNAIVESIGAGVKDKHKKISNDEALLAAVPQHSTPSLAIAKPDVYKVLESCFQHPELPYSQKLDVCRSYLKELGTNRFDTMRRFRHDITEYGLLSIQDASHAPDDFDKALWRFPVQFDVALESLCMSREEYDKYYSGAFPPDQVSTLYGFDSAVDPDWETLVTRIPQFLKSTGLTYCEFIELAETKFVDIRRAGVEVGPANFPKCPPCCMDNMVIRFGEDEREASILLRLMLFIRLWRKLNSECGCREKKTSFSCVRDICQALHLFNNSTTVNPDFVRQLASLFMLEEYFCLPCCADGEKGTSVLGLWASEHGSQEWNRAVKILLECIEKFSTEAYGCDKREANFVKVLRDNLKALSYLAGFSDDFPWYAAPTSTIRFVEVLAKIYASRFTTGEIIFLFTNEEHLDGDDPFPITELSESLDSPLNWPEDDPHGLWDLREKLLKVPDHGEESKESKEWTWHKIVSALHELGQKDVGPLVEFGEHFFPETLERNSHLVPAKNRRWFFPLGIEDTTPTMWSAEPCKPFHFEFSHPTTEHTDSKRLLGRLWVELPLRDQDVVKKLRHSRQLRDAEIAAVQSLYFQPRAMLAPYAQIFSNFGVAVDYLIQEPDECERFKFFQKEFARFFRRCRIIAEHLAYHVGLATGCTGHNAPDVDVAWRILRSLIADENFATEKWEDDSGRAPQSFMWDPDISGNAFAALLGLVGTGLLGNYQAPRGTEWAEMRGGIKAFGHERNEWNTPVLTVIPSINAHPISPDDDVTFTKNGFTLRDAYGEAVAGSEPFTVLWRGLLIVGCNGDYRFCASPCYPDDDDKTPTRDRSRSRQRTPSHSRSRSRGHSPSRRRSTSGGPSTPRRRSRSHGRSASHSHAPSGGYPPHRQRSPPRQRSPRHRSPHRDGSPPRHRPESRRRSPPRHRSPSRDDDDSQRWRVTIKRGQKEWTLLSRCSPGPEAPDFESRPVCLTRGVYDIQVAFHQSIPRKDHGKEPHRLHTGFKLKYSGPDTKDCSEIVPFTRLIECWKIHRLHDPPPSVKADSREAEKAIFTDAAAQFLDLQYVSTMRDIRRTYQRAFKAILLAHRFCLSACQIECDWQSELGFILDHPQRFRGTAYVPKVEGKAHSHYADFDLNFLPVLDPYHPTKQLGGQVVDSRYHPSAERQTAMFDWWERLFDYTTLRRRVRKICGHQVWLLFMEVAQQSDQHDDLDQGEERDRRIGQLLRHLNVKLSLSRVTMRYFARPETWKLLPSNLLDERWPIRVWHANAWVNAVREEFYSEKLGKALVYLWASDDPDEVLDGATGKKDLVGFVQASMLSSHGAPLDVKGLKRLNDGLRCRARASLCAYLCGMNRVPLSSIGGTGSATVPRDLSDLLLQDVEVGLDEHSSRIEDAIHAVQTYVQRARLGAESDWTPELSALWDCRYSSFATWSAFTRRLVYRENWFHWDEMQKLNKLESVKNLTKELRRGNLSIVEAGHSLWWPKTVSARPSDLVQTRELALLGRQHDSLGEGLSLIGTPMRDGRPSWLSPIPEPGPPESQQPPPGTEPPPPEVPRVAADHTASKSSARTSVTPEKASFQAALASLKEVPLWAEAAIRLGARFIRVAAASNAPAIPYAGPDKDKIAFCGKCAHPHASHVDEYYFWLMDARAYRSSYDDVGGSAMVAMNPQFIQDADIGSSDPTDPETDWRDPSKVPPLLKWQSRPMVHLFWTRVHQGTLDPPRRSTEGILVNPDVKTAIPFLDFGGRVLDSLYFPIPGTAIEPTTTTGIFRYDLPTDTAVVVSEQPPPPTPSGPLVPYPYFIHFEPGRPLFPKSGFEIALSVAEMYRGKCSWEEAVKWITTAFNPLERDNTWAQCVKDALLQQTSQSPPDSEELAASVSSTGDSHDAVHTPTATTPAGTTSGEVGGKAPELQRVRRRDAPCCPSIALKDSTARSRAALMKYLRTLFQWANSLMCKNSMEYFQQALVIYNIIDRILGPVPVKVDAHDLIDPPMTIGNFVASKPPLNPELLCFYDEVADRRRMVHESINARRLPTGKRHHEPAPWGSHQRWGGPSVCEEDIKCFSCCQPYRFASLHAKAVEWANLVKSLGNNLLGAFEKGDNEVIAALRATHERQILELGLDVSQNQWRGADWDVQAQDRSLENALTRLEHFVQLQANGLNFGENAYIINLGVSMGSKIGAQISDGIAQGEAIAPDPYVGAAGVAGSPVSILTTPGGEKLSQASTSAARILNGVSDGGHLMAEMVNTQSSWARRAEEWKHQEQVTRIEATQIKRQLLASERRRHIALRELNNHQRQMEHSAEVQDFLRDKFTKQEVYLFLQQETAALYQQAYGFALKTAREAQQAFRYERGDTQREFLQDVAWDSLHEGLLAGERLELGLRAMEHAYMELNCREYELTKHFSLKLHFPLAFLRLKTTGSCEVDIPEWMFDLDFPGHYMRRIRNISLSVPCVAGPYTGVHCRAQLIRSKIRYTPLLPGPEACCCDEKLKPHCDHDPYLATRYNAKEAIAISGGVEDDGLFELNFKDERYLPFEFCGAVSSWRIELPPENNQFDFDTLSDFLIHLNYTSREGGPDLRRRASELAERRVPGAGLRYFDIRHEFPDSWGVFAQKPKATSNERGGSRSRSRSPRRRHHSPTRPHRDFPLRFTRNMFPFLTGRRTVRVRRVHVFVDKDPAAEPRGDHIVVEYLPPRKRGDGDEEDGKCRVVCRAGDGEGCGLYYGVLNVEITPAAARVAEVWGRLRVPEGLCGVRDAYLVCEYEAQAPGGGRECGVERVMRRLSPC